MDIDDYWSSIVGGALIVLYLYLKSRSDKEKSGNRNENGNDRHSPRAVTVRRLALSTTYASVQRQQAKKAAKKYDDNDDNYNDGEGGYKEVDEGGGERVNQTNQTDTSFYNLGILIQVYNHALKLHM